MTTRWESLCRYADNPDLLRQIFELMDLAFPGMSLSDQERLARPLGCHWEKVSTPFVYWDGKRPVSHVGVLEIPLVLEGRETRPGGVHAVCTHPDFRGRGLYKALMSDVMRWCEHRYQTVVLTTSHPALYEPFGFRVVPESRFVGSLAAVAPGRGLRQLDFGRASDVALLGEVLPVRAPVSFSLGVVREPAVFAFNEARRPLHYAGKLDVVVSLEIERTTLRLFDVVGQKIPTLAQIAEIIPQPIERVEVYFCPDRLGGDLEAEPHTLGGDDWLMVRGEFSPEGKPCMLPRTARC
jgi:GNAT superfamily N-acetyltransferase